MQTTQFIKNYYDFGCRQTGKNDVRFKVLYCGICHTDLHMIKNEWGNSTYPLIPGYVYIPLYTKLCYDKLTTLVKLTLH